MSGSDNSTPATDGRDYGVTVVDGDDADPTLVMPADLDTGSYLIVADPENGDIVYLGWDDKVETSTGIPLEKGNSFSVDIDNSEQQIYAVAPSGTTLQLRYIATN